MGKPATSLAGGQHAVSTRCGVPVRYTAVGRWFGFEVPPATLQLALAGLAAVYLFAAELLKRRFHARYARPPNLPDWAGRRRG
jgi:hypothetical protein